MGGAQAIAALAYGTETVPKVDKIFGPGNAWVTAAKQLVAADPAGAACDMPAGPSEVLVIADDGARAEFVAADLLAQAEHDAAGAGDPGDAQPRARRGGGRRGRKPGAHAVPPRDPGAVARRQPLHRRARISRAPSRSPTNTPPST